jgi:hypothetical protein
MSKLYGKVIPDTGSQTAHRPSNKSITVWAQTEHARLEIELWADGRVTVRRYPVNAYEALGGGTPILTGNLHQQQFHLIPDEQAS